MNKSKTLIILIIILICSMSISNAQITSFPYNLSFEASETIDWLVLDNDGDCTNNFYLTDMIADGGTGPNDAHNGDNFISTYYLSCGPSTKIIVGPQFDLTNLTIPSFSFFYHMYGADIGTIEVQISSDNGISWSSPVWQLSGQQQMAKSEPWIQETIELSAYNGQTINIRFRASNLGDLSSFSLDLFTVFDANDNTVNGQGDVFYSYDEAGNRSSRQYTVSLVEDEELMAEVRSSIPKDEPLAATELDESLVNIYPNPVSDFINVELNQKVGVSRVYVFDMTGRVLFQEKMTGSFGRVNMSTFSEGSYVLLIETGENVISRKVVKN